MKRFLSAALPALVTMLALAAGSAGGGVRRARWTSSEVADALGGNPVYVDPDAERQLDEGESRRAAVGDPRSPNTPVYIAVLPAAAADAAGGDPDRPGPGSWPRPLGRPRHVRRRRRRQLPRQAAACFPAGRGRRSLASTPRSTANGDDTVAVLVGLRRVRVGDCRGVGVLRRVRNVSSTRAAATTVAPAWCSRRCSSPAGAGVAGLLAWRRAAERRQGRGRRAGPGRRRRTVSCCGPSSPSSPTTWCRLGLRGPAPSRRPASDFDAAVNRYRAAQAALEHADEPGRPGPGGARRRRGPLR